MAAEEAGQLSLLARLLAPVAGDRSPDLARALIRHFGSLRTLWSASGEAVDHALESCGAAAEGIGPAILAARRLADVAAREALAGEPIDTAGAGFRNYLVSRLGTRREECLIVIHCTTEGLFIAEDFHGGGQRGGTVIPLRRTIRRALDLDARRLVVAHNHPSGASFPSDADLAATVRLCGVLSALEIGLDDHCIVAGSGVASMRDLGLL